MEFDEEDAGVLDPAEVAGQAEAADRAAVTTAYPNAAAWVEGWLLEHYRRDIPGFYWCRYWWRHAEAASRLEALWQAWEAARADDEDVAAISTWWLQHCDPQMAVLASRSGPFLHCDPATDEHRLPSRLPVASPPEGMYRSWDHPEEAAYLAYSR